MKNFTQILFVSMIAFLAINTYGQNSSPDSVKAKIESISKLAFMEGTWIGDGWIMMGRDKKEFVQTETITSKVNNTVLVIEGIGLSKDTTSSERQVIHDAFGVISYDKDKNGVMMTSFATTGGKTETELILIGEKRLQWQFTAENGGTVRFTEDFSKGGEWLEVGEFSYAPGQWYKFFEMKLIRQ